MLRTVDYAPLTAPIGRAEIAAFRERMRNDPRYAGQSKVLQLVVLIVGLSIAGLVVLTTVLSAIPTLLSVDSLAGLAFLIFPLGFLAAFVFIAIVAVRGLVAQGGRWDSWLRLTRFGEANGLLFSPADANPQYPGAIFGQGHSRTVLDHLRSAADRFFDYGNYRYVTGSGKNSTTHNWGFMALSLDRALPHMVLDSRANNGLFGGTNLPATFTKDQVLQLEGDFNEHFTLYCPTQYERDALYVFTPDLMALLIDEAAPYDVEIIDRWMFVYSATPFDLRQPAVHHRLLRIVDTVGAKTLTQTDRYVDERVGDFSANIVAPQGQRLKRGVSVGAIVIGVIVAVFWIGPTLVEAITLLFSR